MIICKECRCFYPVTVSDRYCGECCIGDTKDPIAINADITECCLFEPKQPKKPKPLTNGDRIRQMTDDELVTALDTDCTRCARLENCELRGDPVSYGNCVNGNIEWLKQEVEKDDER